MFSNGKPLIEVFDIDIDFDNISGPIPFDEFLEKIKSYDNCSKKYNIKMVKERTITEEDYHTGRETLYTIGYTITYYRYETIQEENKRLLEEKKKEEEINRKKLQETKFINENVAKDINKQIDNLLKKIEKLDINNVSSKYRTKINKLKENLLK